MAAPAPQHDRVAEALAEAYALILSFGVQEGAGEARPAKPVDEDAAEEPEGAELLAVTDHAGT